MDITSSDRCGFCWSLLADGMSQFVINKMDKVFVLIRHLEVRNAE